MVHKHAPNTNNLMAAYRRVYDSRHLQADCQEPGNRVWASFYPLPVAILLGGGLHSLAAAEG